MADVAEGSMGFAEDAARPVVELAIDGRIVRTGECGQLATVRLTRPGRAGSEVAKAPRKLRRRSRSSTPRSQGNPSRSR